MLNKSLKLNGLFKKFLSFSIGNWIVVVLSLITTPILTRILSPEEYGVLSLFLIVVNLFMILSLLGIDQSFMRFFYEGTKKERNDMIFIGCIISLAMSLLILVVIFITRKFSYELLFSRYDSFLFFLFSISLMVSVFNRYSYTILRMQQKAKLYSTLQVTQKSVDFIAFILLYLIIFYNKDILYLAVYSYVISTSTVLIVGFYLNREIYSNALKYGEIRKESTRKLIRYGLPLSITVMITWVFQFIDRLMLGYYYTIDEVGIYTAAFKFVAIVSIVQTSFTTFWIPLSNETYSKTPENKKMFEKMFNVVLIGMVLVGTGIVLLKDILIVFFGQEFHTAVELIPMLVFIPIMYTLSEITVVGINFKKKTVWHIYISIIVCIVSVILNFLLIPSYGIKGAAFSTGITYILYFLLRTIVGMKFYKFNVFTMRNIAIFASFVFLCMYVFFV